MTYREQTYASSVEAHHTVAQANALLTLAEIADSDAGGWLMEFTARNIVRYIARLKAERDDFEQRLHSYKSGEIA